MPSDGMAILGGGKGYPVAGHWHLVTGCSLLFSSHCQIREISRSQTAIMVTSQPPPQSTLYNLKREIWWGFQKAALPNHNFFRVLQEVCFFLCCISAGAISGFASAGRPQLWVEAAEGELHLPPTPDAPPPVHTLEGMLIFAKQVFA